MRTDHWSCDSGWLGPRLAVVHAGSRVLAVAAIASAIGCYDLPAAQRASACAPQDGHAANLADAVEVSIDTGAADVASDTARTETCANGIDDDLDGLIDEECPCVAGATQRCFTGPEHHAGIGTCAFGAQRCLATASGTAWTECEGQQLARAEVRDGLDNDCDGHVDETFTCVGTMEESCFHGAASLLGVGACRAGRVTCESAFVPDAPPSWIRRSQVCEGEVLPSAEVCDRIDNDCNGRVDDIPERCDGIDNDCDGVVDNGCPMEVPGITRVFQRFGSGGSAIWSGSERSMFVIVNQANRCPDGQVAVELLDRRVVCAPAPSVTCGKGEQLDYDQSRGWQCVDCALVVQFGHLFDFERVCASDVRLNCWEGTTPTFVETRRRWECRPRCDNGEYDLVTIEGRLVCIPC